MKENANGAHIENMMKLIKENPDIMDRTLDILPRLSDKDLETMVCLKLILIRNEC